MKEIWKDIKGYEGHYLISNYGIVKSIKYNKERLLKQGIDTSKYFFVNLSNMNKRDTFRIHILVWDHFGNGKRNGRFLQVDHQDENRLNNHIDNLQLLTPRDNVSKGRMKYDYSSKYIGVSLHKPTQKWRATIYIDGKSNHLGLFINEFSAHLQYQKKLKKLNKT